MSKPIAWGGLFLLVVVGASAQKTAVQAEILIRVKADGNIPSMLLAPATAEASAILLKAGIRVRWETARSRGSDQRSECVGGVADVIDVLVMERAGRKDNPGALGHALPFARFGVRVVIFYDRVAAIQTNPSPTLLGFAMAHEIGHVLIGIDSHSLSGVMRAHWDEHDYARIFAHVLTFAPEDAEAMRSRVGQNLRFCLGEGTASADPSRNSYIPSSVSPSPSVYPAGKRKR